MKNKFFLWLSLLITLSVILHSCRNEDLAKAEANPQRNNSDFFKHKSNLYAKTSIDYINILEAYNREIDFLSKMPDQRGMPIWDKMRVVDTENVTGLMIPLSFDDETMSSVLFTTLDKGNRVTGVRNFDNAILSDIVYNESIDLKLREKMFFTFIYMDNQTFGTKLFTNAPKGILDEMKYDTENGRILIKDFEEPTSVHSESSKMLYIENCGPSWSCKNHETWSNCDHCSACYTTSCSVSIIWIPDESFPGSPSTPGGGGGGGGGTPGSGGTPPKDPCTLNTVFYRMALGCSGGGVDPELPEFDDPCSRIKNKFANAKFKEKVNAIDKPEIFNYDHEMGFASAYPVNTTVTDIQYQPMENSIGTHTVKLPSGNQYFGYMHSHNNESNGGTPIKIFSPADVITFLTSCVRNADEHLSIADAYCMVITSEGNYMLQYNGIGDFSVGPNQINNWKNWYLTEVQKLQKEDGSFDQADIETFLANFLANSVKVDGLEVYYVEKVTGKASKLNTNGTKTPCP